MTKRQKLLIAVVIITLANLWLWSSNKSLLEEMDATESGASEPANENAANDP